MADLDFEGSNTLYGTHCLHAYAAKCPPQLARYCIRYYSKVGETVLDPMAGSGTTLVESRLLGRNCLGFDIDPLARLISEVKSTPLEDDVIEPAFKWVLENVGTMAGEPIRCPEFHNRDYWFSDGVTRDLVLLANLITIVPTDTAVRNFLWVGRRREKARRALTDLKSKQDSHRLVVTGRPPSATG
jgi:hypothetical protein